MLGRYGHGHTHEMLKNFSTFWDVETARDIN